MPILLNTAISALDTPTSLLPFFVKDAFDVTGRTVMANNEGGKHEAREKFIEEAGTSLFWIGGIPAVRWIADQIVKNKIDPKIHFKRINTEGIQNYFAKDVEEKILENGKEVKKAKFSHEDLKGIILDNENIKAVQEKLKKAGYKANIDKGLYKKYHFGVTTAAVLINLVMLTIALPQLNQLLSRKLISKEVNGKKNNKLTDSSDSVTFGKNNKEQMDDFLNKSQKTNKNLSFGSLGDLLQIKELFNFTQMAEKAQLNPVNGMLLLDYGISGSRVTITPRNNNERVENAVKEGGIIFFFYYASDQIKKGLFKVADKLLKTPIELDYKILNNQEFKNILKNPHDKKEILGFTTLIDKEAELDKLPKKAKKEREALSNKIDTSNEISVIKKIDEELLNAQTGAKEEEVFKNFTLKMAQQEGLIKLEQDSKGKWFRHSKMYIETDKVIGLNQSLQKFYESILAKGEEKFYQNVEKAILKTKKVKIASIFTNMAICCASLSFIVPKIQYMIREHRTKTKSAPGIKQYQEMAAKNLI